MWKVDWDLEIVSDPIKRQAPKRSWKKESIHSFLPLVQNSKTKVHSAKSRVSEVAVRYQQISRWQCLRALHTQSATHITLDIAILRMTFCIICTLLLNSGEDLYGSILELRVSGALLGKCSRPPLILSTSQLGPTSSPQLPLCTSSYMQLPKQLRRIQVDRDTCHKGAQTR